MNFIAEFADSTEPKTNPLKSAVTMAGTGMLGGGLGLMAGGKIAANKAAKVSNRMNKRTHKIKPYLRYSRRIKPLQDKLNRMIGKAGLKGAAVGLLAGYGINKLQNRNKE
jgi:hypothetical protein